MLYLQVYYACFNIKIVFIIVALHCRQISVPLQYNTYSSTFTIINKRDNFNLMHVSATTRSRVSSGSIVSDYGLDDRAIGVRSPAGAKDFSFVLCVQTGSGAHPASCTMGTGDPFPGGKSAAGA
jgi:hypothetical protein